MADFDPSRDYPLGERRPDLVRTPSGLGLGELTLEAVRSGRIDPAETRATPETLVRQAEVARAAGRAQLAENLVRAAELTAVPDDVILEIYTALRPRRSTTEELDAWAERLERDYDAASVAAFVREAARAHAERGLARAEAVRAERR